MQTVTWLAVLIARNCSGLCVSSIMSPWERHLPIGRAADDRLAVADQRTGGAGGVGHDAGGELGDVGVERRAEEGHVDQLAPLAPRVVERRVAHTRRRGRRASRPRPPSRACSCAGGTSTRRTTGGRARPRRRRGPEAGLGHGKTSAAAAAGSRAALVTQASEGGGLG